MVLCQRSILPFAGEGNSSADLMVLRVRHQTLIEAGALDAHAKCIWQAIAL